MKFSPQMTPEVAQQFKIRQLVENWAVWRDAGLRDKFRTVSAGCAVC